MLEIENLSVFYNLVRAVHDISLRVKEGEVVTLIGANGAGKTTILRSISGLIPPREGKIIFQGKSLVSLAPHRIVSLGISHVPEYRGIFPSLTVLENLQVGNLKRRLSSNDLSEVYQLFPRLQERSRQLAGTLSGGEQQMLAISRALIARPKLLLLDEPSLGLAPQIAKMIFKMIQRIHETHGTSVLLVEQNATAALQISHRGYVLEVGKIVKESNSSDLLKDDTIRKVYLGMEIEGSPK